MNLADVMDELATRLDTIAGLHVYAYPPDKAHPPAAVVTYPNSINFDQTYARGMDRIELPVVLLVGRVTDRTSRDHLAPYVAGSGASSVKAVLESGVYTAFDTVRVTGVTFDMVEVGAVDHLTATFTLDITGSGA